VADKYLSATRASSALSAAGGFGANPESSPGTPLQPVSPATKAAKKTNTPKVRAAPVAASFNFALMMHFPEHRLDQI
jgi:hypothetical protein